MKSSFQTILLIIFVGIFIVAIFIFSGIVPIGTKKSKALKPQGTVQVWGTIPQTQMQTILDNVIPYNSDYSLVYSEHRPDSLSQDLIVALANNTPPDLIFFNSEIFSQFKDKLYRIPYNLYSERLYRDTNIDGAQIFLDKDGIVGMPLVVDPLVVYYNKDILAKNNFVVPPKTWSEVQKLIPVLTNRDSHNGIAQTTLALGTANNINNMRDILSALFMQTGNDIIVNQGGKDTVVLGATPSGSASAPTAQAMDFYTSFSNSTNSNYSWNSALPNSLDYFLAGRSAFYIGRASELFDIQAQNPNLNFDVMELFQTGANTRPSTFGSFLALGIMKNAPNFTAAYAASNAIASSSGVDTISKSLSLPPVRRDLLLVGQQNPYVSVFFKAALSAFAWPDPSSSRTEEIFATLINDITSGKSDSNTAISNASKSLQSSLR